MPMYIIIIIINVIFLVKEKTVATPSTQTPRMAIRRRIHPTNIIKLGTLIQHHGNMNVAGFIHKHDM